MFLDLRFSSESKNLKRDINGGLIAVKIEFGNLVLISD
jgi:hypothetical protein